MKFQLEKAKNITMTFEFKFLFNKFIKNLKEININHNLLLS